MSGCTTTGQAPRHSAGGGGGGMPNSPAPAPVPGYHGKIPYQQQHEVPGLNLGGGAGSLPAVIFWPPYAAEHHYSPC